NHDVHAAVHPPPENSVHHPGRSLGNDLRLDRFPELRPRRNFQFNHRHEYGRLLELCLPKILRVFFRGNQRTRARCLRRLYERLYFARAVTMVVWKSLCAGNRDLPVLQVEKKGPRIADSTKCEERTRADFSGRKNLHASAKSAEAQQTSGGRKHWVSLKLADRRRSTRRGFGAREDKQSCTVHRGDGFA